MTATLSVATTSRAQCDDEARQAGNLEIATAFGLAMTKKKTTGLLSETGHIAKRVMSPLFVRT